MKPVASELLKEGKTQEEVAVLLGIDQSTVSKWMDITNMNDHISYRPDARVKIPKEQRPIILQRVEEGETQTQVAADYGVTQPAISRIVDKQKKIKEKEQAADQGQFTQIVESHDGDAPLAIVEERRAHLDQVVVVEVRGERGMLLNLLLGKRGRIRRIHARDVLADGGGNRDRLRIVRRSSYCQGGRYGRKSLAVD